MTRADAPVPGDPHVSLDERRPRGPLREAPSRGTRTLSAILPTGRIVWLKVATRLTPATALVQAARLAERAADRQRAGAASGSRGVQRLARSIAATCAWRLAVHSTRARSLRRRIVAGDAAVDRRLSKAVAELRARVARQIRIDLESVARLRRRDLCDKAVIASTWPLVAAYGQTGNPLGANNVALTLSLLTWLVGDEVVAALFGPKTKSAYPVRDADIWSYVAPFANLLAGWWLMNDGQHERFISGVAGGFVRPGEPPGAPVVVVPGPQLYEHAAIVDLSRIIAPGHINDFRGFADVPVVASVSSVVWSAEGTNQAAQIAAVGATVINGTLLLTVTVATRGPVAADQSLIDGLEVAWIVDTRSLKTE